jgi:hypothetical protein
VYEIDSADITTKGRVPKRSAYFARNEITRRIYDALRAQETVSALEIATQAMNDKGLDPEADAKLREGEKNCRPTSPAAASTTSQVRPAPR